MTNYTNLVIKSFYMSLGGKQSLIFKSGEKLFSKFGVKKVSIDMIVKDAGIAKGTFYLYYKNKEELYEKIIVGITDKIKLKIENCPDLDSNPKTRLLHDFVGSFEFIQSHEIFKQIAHGNPDYCFGVIDSKYLQKMHIEFLKSIFNKNNINKDIDYELLAKLMGFFSHMDQIKYYFTSPEDYNKHKIRFAAIFIEGFFSDYKNLESKFDSLNFTKILKNI